MKVFVRALVVVVCFAAFNICLGAKAESYARLALTNADIAVGNLNSQIVTLERLLTRFPENYTYRSQLFDLKLTRSQFLGSYEQDFSSLRALVTSRVSADDYILLARYQTAIHDFGAASRSLNQAEKLGGDGHRIETLRGKIQLALGIDLSSLRTRAQELTTQFPSYENYLLVASIEGELGNFDESHRLFDEALRAYRDSSPLPVAFVHFQRGVMWGERAGDVERARKDYELAVHYVPKYVGAQVHLAEITNQSDPSKAISALQSIVDVSDPEPAGFLGELLIARGESVAGFAMIERARQGYRGLLAQYPLAFADHGAEFFAGPGQDPQRALTLALANLENRSTQRSFIVAIESAIAANEAQKACELSRAAHEIAPTAKPLLDLIQSLASSCS